MRAKLLEKGGLRMKTRRVDLEGTTAEGDEWTKCWTIRGIQGGAKL